MYCVSGVKELKSLHYSWTAKDLKANVGSQSKLYLRPIQKNLSTVSILPQNKSQVKEKCIICSNEVLIKDLWFHVIMCKTREGLLSSESEDDDTLSISVFASQPQNSKEAASLWSLWKKSRQTLTQASLILAPRPAFQRLQPWCNESGKTTESTN